MSLAAVLIGVFWAGLTLYSVLGGADFGAGVLHLLAPGRPARQAIATAMGPVWEANHVWLVFFLSGLLTAFPRAFSALGASVLVPGALALVGIVVRGAALALRSNALFGIASVATPFGFGFTAACIARDELAVGAFQLDVGLLAVAASAALAAAFMAVESAELAPSFRRQATRATALATALALLGLPLAGRPLLDGLSGRGLPAVLTGVFALLLALVALRRALDRLARAALSLAMAALIWGWGLAQYPRLGHGVTVAGAAASASDLRAVAFALATGAAILAPALWLLFRSTQEVLR